MKVFILTCTRQEEGGISPNVRVLYRCVHFQYTVVLQFYATFKLARGPVAITEAIIQILAAKKGDRTETGRCDATTECWGTTLSPKEIFNSLVCSKKFLGLSHSMFLHLALLHTRQNKSAH